MSTVKEEIEMQKIIITDPKTEKRIDIDDYLKQEDLLIDESKFPFEIDHGKCLNCQQKDRDEHSCLCFSCQWFLSGVGSDLKRHLQGKSQLRDIEAVLDNLMRKSIYFDEVSVKEAVELVKTEIAESSYQDDQEKLLIQLKRLEQLVSLGLNWDSGY